MKNFMFYFIMLLMPITLLTSCADKKADPVNPPSANSYTKVHTGYFYHLLGSLEPAWDLQNDALIAENGPQTAQYIISEEYGGDFTGRWISNNGTKFVKANSFNYNSITDQAVIDTYNSGTELTLIEPFVDDIYIAKNGSNYYVIKVTILDPNESTCACGNPGKLTFEYKKK